MSGFKVEKLTVGAVIITDLGLTISGAIGSQHDLTHVTPQDLARSADLRAAMATQLRVLDPRDDTDTILLSQTESEEAVDRHNDTHFGVSGGRFGPLDEPATTPTDEHIVRYDTGTGAFETVSATFILEENNTIIGGIVGAMGQDGTDTTFVHNAANTWLVDAHDESNYDNVGNNGTFNGVAGAGSYLTGDVITLDDGSVVTVDLAVAGDVTQFTVTTSGQTNITAGVTRTQGSVAPDTGQTGFTLTPELNNITSGTMQWDVNDVFLRNSVSDTYNGGTLTIASGATVDFPTGSNITIAGDVSTATINTPAGGFVNANDLINKGYVDALVQGIDWKESVRRATTAAEGDLSGVYVDADAGGPDGVGDTITYDSTAATGVTMDGWEYTGVAATGLVVGDRVLVKDQSNAFENGIYVVTAGSTPTVTVLTRATDQDGSPAAEVSGGNTTFIETGVAHDRTIWSVIWDGQIDFSVPDPINWSQTGAVTSILAGEGLNSTSNVFNLDISTLTQTVAIDPADLIAFQDVAGSAGTDTTTSKITAANFISDLNIVTVTTNGIIVNNGGTITTVAIDHNGAGNLEGLEVTNGDGTAGNPTIGLDIQNLPYVTTGGGSIDAANDQVAVWDSNLDRNVYYTVSDIAGAAAASNSYTNWTNTGNGTGGPIGPGTSSDTIDWNGGDGIVIDMVSGAPDTITVSFNRAGLTNTATDLDDTFAFFDADGGTAHEPEYRSFRDAFTELNVPFDISGTGIVRKTGDSPDTYETISIAASALEDEDGLVVTNGGAGDTGNITVGLDILTMTPSPADLAATDEVAVHDKSEGTAGANRKMTGQQIADGVTNILNITGLTFSTFTAVTTPGDDQIYLSYIDSTRGDAVLSVESHTFPFSDNTLSNNSWVSIGDAVDAESGYIMPFAGRIVGASVHCENVGAGNTYNLDVVIGGPAAAGTATQIFAALTGTNANDSDPALNLSFSAGDKLRVQADQSAGAGAMQDTVVTLMVKWEA